MSDSFVTLKQSSFQIPKYLTVTSIDLCDGYALVGCDNGEIICFHTSESHNYAVVGHITAKAYSNMHTIVRVTDDNRYCFVGTRKGSSEIAALDLSPLLARNLFSGLSSYNFRDNKLRGFGSAVRLTSRDESSTPEYRVVCGLGIKNLHVWRFVSPTIGKRAEWACLYDIVTNGITVECAEFVHGGAQVMSKSTGANVRVWNLPGPTPAAVPLAMTTATNDVKFPKPAPVDMARTKPSFDEISNTVDARAIFRNFAYGGTYDLSVVRLGLARGFNRDDLHLPERGAAEADPAKRKRKLREIEAVVGTPEGDHALVLCTDGGVLYLDASSDCDQFPNNEGKVLSCSGLGESCFGVGLLKDAVALSYNPDRDTAWALRRVTANGALLLLRATQDDDSCVIEVSPLREILQGSIRKRTRPPVYLTRFAEPDDEDFEDTQDRDVLGSLKGLELPQTQMRWVVTPSTRAPATPGLPAKGKSQDVSTGLSGVQIPESTPARFLVTAVTDSVISALRVSAREDGPDNSTTREPLSDIANVIAVVDSSTKLSAKLSQLAQSGVVAPVSRSLENQFVVAERVKSPSPPTQYIAAPKRRKGATVVQEESARQLSRTSSQQQSLSTHAPAILSSLPDGSNSAITTTLPTRPSKVIRPALPLPTAPRVRPTIFTYSIASDSTAKNHCFSATSGTFTSLKSDIASLNNKLDSSDFESAAHECSFRHCSRFKHDLKKCLTEWELLFEEACIESLRTESEAIAQHWHCGVHSRTQLAEACHRQHILTQFFVREVKELLSKSVETKIDSAFSLKDQLIIMSKNGLLASTILKWSELQFDQATLDLNGVLAARSRESIIAAACSTSDSEIIDNSEFESEKVRSKRTPWTRQEAAKRLCPPLSRLVAPLMSSPSVAPPTTVASAAPDMKETNARKQMHVDC